MIEFTKDEESALADCIERALINSENPELRSAKNKLGTQIEFTLGEELALAWCIERALMVSELPALRSITSKLGVQVELNAPRPSVPSKNATVFGPKQLLAAIKKHNIKW